MFHFENENDEMSPKKWLRFAEKAKGKG